MELEYTEAFDKAVSFIQSFNPRETKENIIRFLVMSALKDYADDQPLSFYEDLTKVKVELSEDE